MWGSFNNNNPTYEDAIQPAKDEVRGSRPKLPVDVFYYLNDVQQIALRSLENFGWNLAFIRRPLFVPAVVVVSNGENTKYAVLEEDGSVNLSSAIKWRH